MPNRSWWSVCIWICQSGFPKYRCVYTGLGQINQVQLGARSGIQEASFINQICLLEWFRSISFRPGLSGKRRITHSDRGPSRWKIFHLWERRGCCWTAAELDRATAGSVPRPRWRPTLHYARRPADSFPRRAARSGYFSPPTCRHSSGKSSRPVRAEWRLITTL